MNNTIVNHMNSYQKICDLIQLNMLSFLNRKLSIVETYNLIEPYFRSVNKGLNYVKDFEVRLISTKDIIEPWYYDPKCYSEKAIEILQNKQEKYFWINNLDQWESQNYDSNEQIAEYLSNWTCFDFPKNIKLMLHLIKEGYWLLKPGLPILSKKQLIDTNEVYSWDDRYVLTGTSIENIAMISIEHWNRIVENDKSY